MGKTWGKHGENDEIRGSSQDFSMKSPIEIYRNIGNMGIKHDETVKDDVYTENEDLT